MEENKKTMSPFCEAIMDATENVSNDLRQPGDCAIVLASDNNTLATRFAGNQLQILRLLYRTMKANRDFRQLLIEVAMSELHELVINEKYEGQESEEVEQA